MADDTSGAAPAAAESSSFLSLGEAAGMLREQPATPPAAPSQPERVERAPAEPASAEPQQYEEEEDQQQPAEASETDSDVPPLDPPPFWKKAARELFSSLPRDAQEAILERERERDTGVNKALEESATERRKAEAAREAADRERQAYNQRLESIVPMLQAQIQTDFPDIRTHADVVNLARNDPARYTLWRAQQDAIQSVQAEQQQAFATAQQQADEAKREAVRREFEALVAKRPDLKDATKRSQLNSELRNYAIEAGYSSEQYDSNMSHLNLLMLEKAMLYDRAQKARAQAVEKPLPRVTRPGTAPATRAQRLADQQTQQMDKLRRSGSIEDALSLMRVR